MTATLLRTIVALVVALAIASIVLVAAFEFWLTAYRVPLENPIELWPSFTLVLIVIATAPAWIVHALLMVAKLRDLAHYLSFSALSGGALTLCFLRRIMDLVFHMGGDDSRTAYAVGIVGFGALLGATMGATFWLIRRPDRDQASAEPPNSTSE